MWEEKKSTNVKSVVILFLILAISVPTAGYNSTGSDEQRDVEKVITSTIYVLHVLIPTNH